MLRKVGKELFPYVIRVMDKYGIGYSSKEYPNYFEISTDISSRHFSDVVNDAKCEMQRQNSNCPEIPVVSCRTALNPSKMEAVLNEQHANCFVLLKSEEKKFANKCM